MLINRIRFLARQLLAFFCLALLLAPAAAGQSAHRRIVAVGDLHGDFIAWRAIAAAAQLIDARGKWTGGNTIFVQTGDVADRGPDTLGILNDLMRLQREAKRSGGQVIALVGNHEAMNMTDDLRYVSAVDYAAYADSGSAQLRDRVYEANKVAIAVAYRQSNPSMSDSAVRDAWLAATPLGSLERAADWHANGRIGRWVLQNPAVAVVDGNLFVHGGLSLRYQGATVDAINRGVAQALAAHDTTPTAIINDQDGPLWYRGYVQPEAVAPATDEQIDRLLQSFGATRMIIGHTPVLSGIAILHEGRVVDIDTGITAYYNGKLGYLEIVEGQLIPRIVPRPAADGGK